jgi:hypothetical protein
MASILINPVYWTVGTSTTPYDVAFTVPSSFDDALDVALVNSTGAAIAARVGLGLGGSVVGLRIYDLPIEANKTLLVYEGLKLPAGYQIICRGAAAGLFLEITGVKRPA